MKKSSPATSTNRRWAALAAALGIAVTLLVIALSGVRSIQGLIGSCAAAHSTDEELIEHFRRHRASFDRVVLMIHAHPELAKGGGPFVKRWEYRWLLYVLGVHCGVSATPDGKVIELTVSSRGFVTHNSQKGYLHSDDPLPDGDLTAELDSASRRATGSAERKIEDGWHLFFEGY